MHKYMITQLFVSLPSSIGFHLNLVAKVNIFITLGDLEAPHVCVIPWVSSDLVQGLLSFAHMILPIMCLIF